MTDVAIGFKGAVAVTLTRTLDVLDRRTIVVRTGQPYHLARSRPFAEAEAIIRDESDKASARALAGLKAILESVGSDVAFTGICTSAYRLPSSLEALLASHPACHAAEGQMTRDALISASESLGMRVVGVLEKEAEARVAALGLGVAEMAALGKTVGPPWRKDERLATCAARVALG